MNWNKFSSVFLASFLTATAIATTSTAGLLAAQILGFGMFRTDLAVSALTGPSTISDGQQITYKVTLKNNGPLYAPYNLQDTGDTTLKYVSTTAPGCAKTTTGVQCKNLPLQPTQSATYFFTYAIDPQKTCAATVKHTTAVSVIPVTGRLAGAGLTDTNLSNNSLTITTSRTCTTPSADLAIVKSAPATVAPGGTIMYKLTEINNGPGTLFNVKISDPIPVGTTFVSVSEGGCKLQGSEVVCTWAVGNPGSFSVTVQVPKTAVCDSVISNTATISSSNTTDPNTANNQSTVRTTIACAQPTPPTADLSLWIGTETLTVNANSALIAKATVTNAGPDTTYPTVTWIIPDDFKYYDIGDASSKCAQNGQFVQCPLSPLAKGGTAYVSVGYMIPATIKDGVQRTVYANVSSNDADPNSANNSGKYTVIVKNPTATTGNLYVTNDSTPTRPRQLLGGTLNEPVLRLKFRADGTEDIDVADIQLTGLGEGYKSIDRLELYKEGSSTPFASATIGGCGSDSVPDYSRYPAPALSFCAKMQTQQLVVTKGTAQVVLVRPRMKTDVDGAVAGKAISIGIPFFNQNGVRARGVQSKNNLQANNGDRTANGEIFIGVDSPDGNGDVFGNDGVMVLSKIIAIKNANPDADGTNMPTGISPIGQFKFTAAPEFNSKNGLNKVALGVVLFSVNSQNVLMDPSGWKGYNKADPTLPVLCYPYTTTGSPITSPTEGTLLVSCAFSGSPVDNIIDQGTDDTFVLQANILNPKIRSMSSSALQVSIDHFSDPTLTSFGPTGSHFSWQDMDSGGSTVFFWVEYPDTVIKSTSYQG